VYCYIFVVFLLVFVNSDINQSINQTNNFYLLFCNRNDSSEELTLHYNIFDSLFHFFLLPSIAVNIFTVGVSKLVIYNPRHQKRITQQKTSEWPKSRVGPLSFSSIPAKRKWKTWILRLLIMMLAILIPCAPTGAPEGKLRVQFSQVSARTMIPFSDPGA
jgi:hypothetical protein